MRNFKSTGENATVLHWNFEFLTTFISYVNSLMSVTCMLTTLSYMNNSKCWAVLQVCGLPSVKMSSITGTCNADIYKFLGDVLKLL